MQEPVHPDLLAAVEAYCAANKLSKSSFGHLVLGDPRFVFDLEKGRELRRATLAKVWSALRSPPRQADVA